MNARFTRLAVKLAFLAVFLTVGVQSAIAADYWQDVAHRSPQIHGDAPLAYRQLALDWTPLREALSAHANGVGATLSLPTPDGGSRDFVLADSGVMPAEMQANFPDIRSYIGTDGSGTTARIDISMLGLQATVYDREGQWLVRPEKLGMDSHYLSFRRADAGSRPAFRCETHGEVDVQHDGALPGQSPETRTVTGAAHRNYRAAIAANHFWVQAVAGAMSPPQTPTVAIGLAAVVNAMNRVNQIYRQDFSITMTLIPNNDLLIFPDATGDTFGSEGFNNGDSLNQITAAITGIIGVGNYDMGHLFTTGSGGVAGLGVICNASTKGRGTTGLPNGATLQTDVFYIDYVAHEMGHQFGGSHTYNSTVSNCNGQRTASSAYEPGSGSTIQAYAGICGSANLQSNSDPYFHARSLLQMGTHSTTGTGGTCSQNTAKGYAEPVVSVGATTTIPASTPYVLTGSATSAGPGAVLTYTWEQYDLGAANNSLATDPGTGPIQRSWLPTTSPRRYLPKLSHLLAGTNATGEILPTTNRTMTYRLTARDGVPAGGSTNSADLALTVVNTAGPFTVTAPAAPATWTFGTTPAQAITWNVASTDVAPVSCSAVDIDLVVLSGTGNDLVRVALLQAAAPNNGSATVAVPNASVTGARVRVSCANNVFFNISAAVNVVGPDILFRNGFDSPVLVN